MTSSDRSWPTGGNTGRSTQHNSLIVICLRDLQSHVVLADARLAQSRKATRGNFVKVRGIENLFCYTTTDRQALAGVIRDADLVDRNLALNPV